MRTIRDDGQVALHSGDAAEVLRQLPVASVDCVMTPPPYWGLRDHGVERQLGAESTVQQYVARLVEIFGELAQVLTPRGTVWLNLGDSYGGSWGHCVAAGSTARTAEERSRTLYGTHRPPQASHRAKDLVVGCSSARSSGTSRTLGPRACEIGSHAGTRTSSY